MKKILSILAMVVCCLSLAFAQQHQKEGAKGPGARPSFEQFLQVKTDFVLQEMGLPKETEEKFRPVFVELQTKKGELMHKYEKVRRVMNKHRKGETITDEEYLEAVRMENQRAIEDAKLEAEYQKRFESILTPKQLYSFMMAEQHFKSHFMEQKAHPGHGKGHAPRN